MNLAYTLSGGAPLIKRYKVGATAIAGIPLLDTSTGAAGVRNATTTSLTNAIGCSLDAATYTTTQTTSMIEGIISVVINPDAIWRARMSGAAADGTQLLIVTNSAASSGGTLITITTGDQAPNSPTQTDGTAFCVTGNNAGLTRKITSTAATTATVTVPFPYTIASGDVFLLVPWSPADATAITAILTTALLEVRADQDAAGDAVINVVDVEFDRGGLSAARRNSYLHFLLRDHVLKDS